MCLFRHRINSSVVFDIFCVPFIGYYMAGVFTCGFVPVVFICRFYLFFVSEEEGEGGEGGRRERRRERGNSRESENLL